MIRVMLGRRPCAGAHGIRMLAGRERRHRGRRRGRQRRAGAGPCRRDPPGGGGARHLDARHGRAGGACAGLHARGGLRLLMLSAHDDSAHARWRSMPARPASCPSAARRRTAGGDPAVAAGRRWLDADIARQLALAAIDGSGAHPAERLSRASSRPSCSARGRSVQDIAGRPEAVGQHHRHPTSITSSRSSRPPTRPS